VCLDVAADGIASKVEYSEENGDKHVIDIYGDEVPRDWVGE